MAKGPGVTDLSSRVSEAGHVRLIPTLHRRGSQHPEGLDKQALSHTQAVNV